MLNDLTLRPLYNNNNYYYNNYNVSVTKIILLYDWNFCHLLENIIPEPNKKSHDSMYIVSRKTFVSKT